MANPLCHFELMSSDPSKCKAFYRSIFSWEFDEESMPGYSVINAGTEPTGAIFKKPDTAPGSCMNIYFQVDNIDQTLEKVKQHGGTIIVPNTHIPGTGQFAMFTDPEGITIGLMQPA